jgi:ribosomal protein S19E (S16A)
MPFVAFPHQFNDLIKLRQILQTTDALLKSGKEIDDESLGYTLFLKGLIKQRKPSSIPLSEQLDTIKRKPKSDQSPLTIARDIRRLFLLLGLIQRKNGKFQITERGRKIADTPPNSQMSIDEKKVWFEGLQNLVLRQSGASTTFRPLRVMLEMLADKPIETRLLTFAFTAMNESYGEIQRIKDIVDRISTRKTQFSVETASAEISESNARNSVKILPALAEFLGLIRRSGGVASLTPYGRTLLDRQVRQVTPAPPVTRRREPFFRIISSDEELRRKWKPTDTEAGEVDYDPQDETERLNRLRERVDEHQETLVKLRHLYDGKGWRIGIGNFDLLTEKGDIALLHEVKTLAEDIRDERLRIIDGLGKLMFYEAFDVPPLLINKSARVQKIIVFSRKPLSQEHIDFLTKIGIWVIWFNQEGEINGEIAARDNLQKLLK